MPAAPLRPQRPACCRSRGYGENTPKTIHGAPAPAAAAFINPPVPPGPKATEPNEPEELQLMPPDRVSNPSIGLAASGNTSRRAAAIRHSFTRLCSVRS